MKSPFKFLDSYTKEDKDIFFGRDQEITELYRRIFESKILLVYGISGTGKSSLINCGLASRFDDSDWLPVNVRRGSNIIDSLNEAIIKQALSPLKKNLSASEKLQSIYLDHFKPVYLIFDQFEELFIFGTREEKTAFIKLISGILESKTQCRIIFIIREEFLAGITEFEYDLPEVFSNRFRVEKMKRANAIHAIEGPCKVHNIESEKAFSEELIDKLCPSGNEIELTYMQIYLDRIFRIAVTQKEQEENLKFSKEILASAGSVSDLLGQFLEEQIREMDDPNKGLAILKSFISVQGTKRQMNEQEILDSIVSFGTVISKPDIIKYLSKFVDLRILRERDESGHFELRHDALAAKIFEKFTLLEKELLEVKLFVENAWQTFNSRKTYLNHDDLDYLSTYEKRLFLPPVLSKFVQESKDKLQSQQRALRRLTSLVAIIFLLIVAAGVQYYLNKKGFAQTRELTTLTLIQEKVDPLTSIRTAFKVREKDSVSTVVRGTILSNFFKLLQEKLEAGGTNIPKELLPRAIPVKGSVLAMHMNKPGNHLFGWTDSREVFTCGISDSLVRSFKVEYKIVTVVMSDNARYLAIIYENSKGNIYTRDGKKLFAFETKVNHLMNNRLVRFFPSGKYFMAAVNGNKAVIYDSTGVPLFDLIGHAGSVNSLDISSDGRFIVTASSDKTGLIWNFNHKTRLFSPYDTLVGHKDTVWSCEFNRTGKWILTSSADSVLNIWSLNGNRRYLEFSFAVNYINGPLYWWPAEEPRMGKYHPYDANVSEYYNKICDAGFSANERAIIALNYNYNKIKSGIHDSTLTTNVVYFGWSAGRSGNVSNPFLSLMQHQADSIPYYAIQQLKINSDRQIFAAVQYQSSDILLVASDGYQLLTIPGILPEFSYDGNRLFYLGNKSILTLPLSSEEIYNYVFERKLFGNPLRGREILKIL